MLNFFWRQFLLDYFPGQRTKCGWYERQGNYQNYRWCWSNCYRHCDTQFFVPPYNEKVSTPAALQQCLAFSIKMKWNDRQMQDRTGLLSFSLPIVHLIQISLNCKSVLIWFPNYYPLWIAYYPIMAKFTQVVNHCCTGYLVGWLAHLRNSV